MCLNCGCGVPDDRHGSSANIVTADLQRAAEANGQTLEETARNVAAAATELSPDSGDSPSAG